MSTEFISSVNGKDLFAKRAERTRSGLVIETYNDGTSDVPGILPSGVGTSGNAILATQQYVLNQIGGVAGAMVFKDVVDGDTKVLPTTGYKAGWVYEVAVAGTYAGETCEAGDMIICVKDYAAGTASNDDWAVVEKNLDGVVIGPADAVNAHIAVFNGTSGKLIADGGAAIVTDVDGSSTDAEVPTAAAVNTAITGAVGALDATVSGAAASKTLATLTETDGVIDATFQDIQIAESQVTNLETDLGTKANKSELAITDVSGDSTKKTIQLKSGTSQDVLVAHQDISGKADKAVPAAAGNFAGLDANGNLTDSGKKATDFKTVQTAVSDPTVPTTGTTESLSFIDTIEQDTNGVITATKKNMRAASTSQTGIVQLQGTIGATETENSKAATPKAVRDAIDALDVSDLVGDSSGSMAGKTLLTLTEEDGKIAATFQNIQITASQVTDLTTALSGKADKVTSAMDGNFAGLDSNGNLTDSGKKAADFATAAQGTKAESAIQGVEVNGTALTPDSNKVVGIPAAAVAVGNTNAYGVVTLGVVSL